MDFHIVCAGRNLGAWAALNLYSLQSQRLHPEIRFHATWIDDASTDNTFEIAQACVSRDPRFTLIKSDHRRGSSYHYVKAIQERSNPDDIIVMVDADDWLAHSNALSLVAKEYLRADEAPTWMTYGSLQTFRPGARSEIWVGDYDRESILTGNVRRSKLFFATHLKTFFKELFDLLTVEDLTDDDGCPWPYAGDMALMLPMLEMAREHARRISDVLYIYREHEGNCHADPNTRQAQQDAALRVIARKPKPKLERLE
jgi:glycosyltransferase involved in cell wall biosynthesis